MTADLALDEYLDSQEIEGIETLPADEDGPERYRLTTLDAADWAFRKLKREKERRADVIEQARVQRERIDAWVEASCTPIDHSIEYFEGLLKEWGASQVLDELAEKLDWEKVKKTHSVPNGKVAARKSTDGSFVTSEEGRKNALAAIEALGRWELLSHTVGATPLEEARKAGTVSLDDRGTYRILNKVTGEWITLPGVAREGRGQISYTVTPA
jgi:hypothetical protein